MNEYKPEVGVECSYRHKDGLSFNVVITGHGVDGATYRDATLPTSGVEGYAGFSQFKELVSPEDEERARVIGEIFDIVNGVQTNKHRALEIAEEFYLKGFRKMSKPITISELYVEWDNSNCSSFNDFMDSTYSITKKVD